MSQPEFSSQTGFGNDYYSIDAILAEDEGIPCTFNVDAYNLGFLDNSNQETQDLTAGAKVDVPLWLGTVLSIRNMVTVETPKCYASRFRSHLLADPHVINLRERSPYYYETGLMLAQHLRDHDAVYIIPTLIKALSSRYRDILDRSQNSRDEDVTPYTETLTVLEQNLFQTGYHAAEELFQWKIRDFEQLKGFHPKKRRRC